jgi:hypothetical protein
VLLNFLLLKGKGAGPVVDADPPKEWMTVKITLPSDLPISYTLPYMEKKPEVAFNFEQDFQVRSASAPYFQHLARQLIG